MAIKVACVLYLQLRKEGFPDRLCNYCQLQLNMFHAFLKKAEASNNTFEEILGSNQDVALEEEPPDQDVKEQFIEMHEADADSEDEFEYMIDEAFKSSKHELTDEGSQQKTITHQLNEAEESNPEHSEREGNDYNESK